MTDDKAYAATPAETLQQHIMDSRIAKSEAEWWACKEIVSLRAALSAEKALTHACERVDRRNEELLEEVARLRKALKPFAEYYVSNAERDDDGVAVRVGEIRASRAAMGETD